MSKKGKAPTGNTRLFLALGGFLGFCVAFFSSIEAGNEAVIALRDGSIGSVVGAILLKIYLEFFYSNLRQALVEKSKEMAEQDDKAKEETT